MANCPICDLVILFVVIFPLPNAPHFFVKIGYIILVLLISCRVILGN